MVLRRYTPPTCTLEITAKGSLPFRWAGIAAFKDLRFELHFDAPQLPEDKQVTIRGNRAQLDALQEAVTAYVRQFLSQSPAEKGVEGLTKAEENGKEQASPALPASRVEMRLEPTAWELEAEAAAVPAKADGKGSGEHLQPVELPEAPAEVEKTQTAESEATDIYLVRKSLVVHDLFLGTLATEQTGQAIHLSSLQLFDLGTALDEYTADVVGLPREKGSNWLKQPPLWAKTVAVVAVSLGLATAGLKLVERQYAQMAAPAAPQQPVALQPPPPAPPAPPAPPPDVLGAPVLKLPKDGAMPPTPEPATGAVASKLPTIPVPAASVPAPLKMPAGSASGPVALTPRSSPPAPARVAIVPNSAPAVPKTVAPVPPPTSIHVPAPVLPAPAVETAPHQTVPPAAATEGAVIPTPAVPPVAVREPEAAPSPSAPPAAGNSDPAPALPPIPGLPDFEPAVRSQLPEASAPGSGEAPHPRAGAPASGETPQPAPHSTSPPASTSELTQLPAPHSPLPEAGASGETAKQAEAQTGTTSQEMPQLAEAMNYFAQRWKPPLGLKEPLEYTISVNADGSVGQIIPRGQASYQFVESTGMPLMNQPFVSPVKGGEPVRIRVLLKPDGAVQTLVEPWQQGL